MVAFKYADDTIAVFLAGDSTMADKETSAYPETGWGMPFKYFFGPGVTVRNMAQNGRSTKSFIEEKKMARNSWPTKKGRLCVDTIWPQ